MGWLNYLLNRKYKDIKLTLLGNEGSGKTTLLKYLLNDKTELVSTYGFNCKNFKFNNQQNIIIYDIGGNENDRNFWQNYYDKSNGIIFIIDQNNINDLNLNILKNILTDDLLKYTPILILINYFEEVSEDKKKENLEFFSEILYEYCEEERYWCVIDSNCKLGKGVVEGLTWIIFQCNKIIKENLN